MKERLHIRPWGFDDAQAFFELSLDQGFTAFPITNYKQTSIDTAREWIRTHPEKFGVWVKETGELVGMGGLTPWNWEGEELVDITYRLRTSAHGKGFGWELAQWLVEHGKNKLGLRQITATITPENIPSKKIAQKLGMRFDKRIELLGVATDLYRLDLK